MDVFTRYTLTFVLYAFIGYLSEVVYCSIGQRHLVDRGFLYGPWLPIYGIGGLIVDIFLVPLSHYPILVFVAAVILTSTVEYIGSWGLEKIFSIKLWDYSKKRFNINGRVCLLNSTLFGIMSIFLVYVAYPWVEKLLLAIPYLIAERVADALRILFAVDLTLSVMKMSGFKKALIDAREKARSIEERILELKSMGKTELSEEFRVRLSAELMELKDRTSKSYKRILQAFPSATSRHEDLIETLQGIRSWVKEGKQKSIEMRKKLKETKDYYMVQNKEEKND